MGCLLLLVLPALSPGAVFTGYYRNNPPGVHFSMPVLRALLWALLKAGMVPDIFSVLSVSLGHNIMVSVVLIHLLTIIPNCSYAWLSSRGQVMLCFALGGKHQPL